MARHFFSELEMHIEQLLEQGTLYKEPHMRKLKKDLYELKRHPWDSTYSYMRSLKITYSDEDLNLCYKVEY